LPEKCLILDVLNNVEFEHLLADHENFLLIGADSLRQPLENLLTATAHCMLAEPAILVVLHLDVFMHNVGPLFKVLKLVIFDLRRTPTTTIVFLGNLLLLCLTDRALIRVIALLLCVNQINDLKNLMLNVVLIDEGQDLIPHCWEVCHLRDRRSFVIVFI